ncbi:MAG: hypothetical protein AAGE61_09965 [Pseudomonadota bacterium]
MAAITEADIRGLWRRDYIKIPAKDPTFEDHDTAVYWFQADGLYADLRIPKALQDDTGNLTEHNLKAAIASAEGFAGISDVSHNRCTWKRFINLQGPEPQPDIGDLARDPEALETGMLETGLDDAYLEYWHHLEKNAPEGRAYVSNEGDLGVLIHSRTHFLVAIDKPEKCSEKTTIKEQKEGLSLEDVIQRSGHYCLGEFMNGKAVVRLSNLPMLVGIELFESDNRDNAALTFRGVWDGEEVTPRPFKTINTTEFENRARNTP